MTVRASIEARLSASARGGDGGLRVRLPRSLKADKTSVRTAMLQRLAASRLFALGDRSGVLRSAQKRSGRPFRLDVRQRVIVKALVSRHLGKGGDRAAALARHVSYLGRCGAGLEGEAPAFFSATRDGVDADAATQGWSDDRHHFRFIVSPEHGDRIADLKDYARDIMRRVSDDLGEPCLNWVGVCHFDTDQPHIHLLIRGKRGDGRDLVIARDYVGYGFRSRAQEVAQERLGDLSRQDAEKRIWKETEADRFTAFDRRLIASMDADRTVADGIGGHDAWAALTRGRLQHLERLGLADRVGKRFRLAGDMEPRLRRLQVSRDVIRSLNQRRLDGARNVRQLEGHAVTGKVVKAGFHDELGASPFVVVRAADGQEHYARLSVGKAAPTIGKTVTLSLDARGFAQVIGGTQRGAGRGAGFER